MTENRLNADALANRVDELTARYELSQRASTQLASLLALLGHDPLAPTSVRDPERILEDHLADSLVALELEPVRSARQVVDVGAGAGLPGLPLAIARPHASFSLVESAARKCSFIRGAVAVCSLANVEVVQARAESWSEGLRRFDLAVVRALSALDVVLEYAAPLLVVGGYLVAWRGRRDAGSEAAGERAAAVLGLTVEDVRQVTPYPDARDRHLHVFLKVRETPDRFPRRPGMASKRPLGRA